MSRLFNFLNELPWTKPIAIIVFVVDVIVFVTVAVLGCVFGFDLPPNAADFGKWLGVAVIGISGAKSGYEAVHGPKEEPADDDK